MIHTRFALRRPVTTLMSFVAVVLVGVLSTKLLPLELFPEIRFPGILVNIPYEGSTPEEVEQLITRPAEEAVATLSGIKEMRSTSSENGLEMIVFFEWGRDPAAVGFEVRTKLESIRHELPPAANRVLTRMFAAGDDRIVAVRISSQEDLSRQYDMLDRYLKKPIERLDGIARVSLEGVEPLELRILVDPARLAAHGVDVVRLRDALEGANFSISAGEVTGGQQRFLVRPVGEFRTLDDVRDFIVAGGVRLRDIADVRMVSPAPAIGRHLNGRPGVGLDVFKATGANIVDVADRVMAVIEAARQVPQLQGVDVIVLTNQAENIRDSLADLRNAGLIGAALALVVLFAFLRDWRTTLIVSLAVPFSLLMTLAAMFFLGFSLNILTMMGMMLAVGLLVDNAVVVTESIFRHRQMNGADPIAATLAGVDEVGLAVLAGTLSTIIVFLPIVFGEESQMSVFMVHVAVPIVVAMIASLFVAQTIIPTLTARFPAPPPIAAGSRFARLQDGYVRALDWLFHHKWKGLLFVLLTLLSPIALFATGLLKVDMFPQDASDRLYLPYHIEGTYPMARIEEVVTRVENYLEENRERFGIELVYSFFTPSEANSVIKLLPREQMPLEPRELITEIENGLPEIIIGKPSFRFEENQGGTGGFNMRLTGESTEQLVALSRTVVQRLRDVKGFDSVRTTAKAGEQEVQVIVDRDRAARLGLTAGTVAQTLAAAMRGDRLKEFRAEDREIRMRLAFRADDRQTIEDLAATPLYLPDGTRSTLGAVANFRISQTARTIDRVDRMTSVVIEGIVARDSSLDAVKKGVEAAMKDFPLPPGVSWKFGRSVQENDDTAATMQVNLLLAVALIFLVMAALFESLLYPVSIITSILFAVVGVFWGLTISGTPLTFMAMVGIMILTGVIVNIGIVLIAHVIDLRRAGMDRQAAILEAARHRLRPILMTSLTTLLAMLPIALGDTQIGGEGPAYYPMARALISGLLFGSVTSLFFVPLFYVWLDDWNHWRMRVGLYARGRRGNQAGMMQTIS
ncbi:MAG: efflux RND transporter permease subunit [Gammaproteobacteria bacterium]|nr:efflux RND transporter permease subunit [Gammaproteobacteria bacterium]